MRIVGYRHDPLVPKESGPIKSLETAEPSGHEGDGTAIGRSKPRRAKADGQIGTEKARHRPDRLRPFVGSFAGVAGRTGFPSQDRAAFIHQDCFDLRPAKIDADALLPRAHDFLVMAAVR